MLHIPVSRLTTFLTLHSIYFGNGFILFHFPWKSLLLLFAVISNFFVFSLISTLFPTVLLLIQRCDVLMLISQNILKSMLKPLLLILIIIISIQISMIDSWYKIIHKPLITVNRGVVIIIKWLKWLLVVIIGGCDVWYVSRWNTISKVLLFPYRKRLSLIQGCVVCPFW